MSTPRSPTASELNRQTVGAALVGFVAATVAYLAIGNDDPLQLWWLAPGALGGGALFTAWFWRMLVGDGGYSYYAAAGAGALAVACSNFTMWLLPVAMIQFQIKDPLSDAITGYPAALLGMGWLSLVFTSYVTFPVGIGACIAWTWWARRQMEGPPPI